MPHSPAAEKALLGICLLDADAALRILAAEVDPADFYGHAHILIAQAVMALHTVGAAVEPVSVAGYLDERGLLSVVGGPVYLMELQAEAPSRNPRRHADVILDRSARRKLKVAIATAADETDDLTIPVDDAVSRLTDQMGNISRPILAGRPALDIAEFCAQPFEYRWLVPGLLERGDRLIITGEEGQGKSSLVAQLAVQLAAGRHPWAPGVRFEPTRTLIIDLENSHLQVSRRLQPLLAAAKGADLQQRLGVAVAEPFDPGRVRVEVRPQGIDLLKRTDRRWLTERVAANKPDLLLTGPIYKLHRGNPVDEAPAAEVSAYLDELRTTFDVGLVLEAHSPHGSDGGKRRTLRPYGASLWMRWPEFGFGIRKAEDDAHADLYRWEAFRKARDSGRLWPEYIKYGKIWPWVNAYSEDHYEQF